MLSGEIALKNNHYYYYYLCRTCALYLCRICVQYLCRMCVLYLRSKLTVIPQHPVIPHHVDLCQVQPKHVKEAFRLLNKSIIRVEQPDIHLDDDAMGGEEGQMDVDPGGMYRLLW